MENNLINWHNLKNKLNNRQKLPSFKERQIWWCNIGENIGSEENGKGSLYSRPVLIIKKLNNKLFFGVPLTTKIKDKFYYQKIHFKDKEQCAMLCQIRVWDCKRLAKKMGNLPSNHFNQVKKEISKIILEPNYSTPPNKN